MRLTSLKLESLHDLYITELRDLYNAETQLVKALPRMAQAANAIDLRTAFQNHLEETKAHVSRLQQVFQKLDEEPTGETCAAMKGLIEEGDLFVKAKGNGPVIDAGLIAAAQRVEHYKIAGYGTVRTIATHLGYEDAANILQETLNDESDADKLLTDIAESHINTDASMCG